MHVLGHPLPRTGCHNLSKHRKKVASAFASDTAGTEPAAGVELEVEPELDRPELAAHNHFCKESTGRVICLPLRIRIQAS